MASNPGISVYFGPMWAGKTTRMCSDVERYLRRGLRCVIIKHADDRRYNVNNVQTHRGLVFDNIETVVTSELKAADYADYSVIGIDEGQFFPNVVDFAEELANAGKHVIVAYLDATWERKPFGRVGDLLAKAERVEKLSAICATCPNDAHFSKRIVHSGDEVLIGGAESYQPACRVCFGKK